MEIGNKMACGVCGSPNTVRSHIIPRALVHDSKEGAQAAVYGERGTPGYRLRQSGKFDDDILCEAHENLTGYLDRYGVDFVRALNAAGNQAGDRQAVSIPNPRPDMLQRFVLSVIWREVQSKRGQAIGLSLGSWAESVTDAVFWQRSIAAPLVASYQRFTAERSERVPIGIHPFRVRMLGRNFWQFTVSGCAFWLCLDRRGLPPKFDGVRADLNDPARAVIGDAKPLEEVGILRAIFDDMRRR